MSLLILLKPPKKSKKMQYPNYVGAGSYAQHMEAELILDLHAARATGIGTNSNTDTNKGAWTDLSGNSYHGTLNNFAYTEASGWNADKLTLDGTDDKVTLPSVIIPQIFTIEMWVNPRNTSTSSILMYRQGSGTHSAIELSCASNAFGFVVDGGAVYTGASANQLTHVVVWTDGTNINLCKNNGAVVSGAYTNTKTYNFSIPILGANPWGGYFPGSIHICRIYNRALTPVERTQNFNAGVTW